MKKLNLSKYNIATFIALLFHVSGLIGMFTSKHDWFVSNTPLNLILMFGLIIWTHSNKNRAFWAFVVIAFVTGMITEIIGVNTGLLFGEYNYGKVLGLSVLKVPLLIGINWFTVMYCCGVVITKLHNYVENKIPAEANVLSNNTRLISFIVDGALLATFFDFILEPVAVKLGYWTWLSNGTIPAKNYICWFIISALLLAVFKLLTFPKANQFAVHLLIIELLFFGALRTFL